MGSLSRDPYTRAELTRRAASTRAVDAGLGETQPFQAAGSGDVSDVGLERRIGKHRPMCRARSNRKEQEASSEDRGPSAG